MPRGSSFPNLLYLKSNPYFSNQFRYLFLREYFRKPTHTSAQLDVSPPTVDLPPHILVCPLLMAPITSHLGAELPLSILTYVLIGRDYITPFVYF